MFEAYHRALGKGFWADEVWTHFKNTDPHKEDWTCCPVCQKKVTPHRKHTRHLKDRETGEEREIEIPSYFALAEGVGGCINAEGESEEHKLAKQLIAIIVDSKSAILRVKGIRFNADSLQFKEVPRLPFRWERVFKNQEGKTRVDVLFKLTQFHPLFGTGISFEVHLSPISEERKRERTRILVNSGYSVSWLGPEETEPNRLLEYGIDVTPWVYQHYLLFRDLINEQYTALEKIKGNIDEVNREIAKSCRTCKHATPHKELDGSWVYWCKRFHRAQLREGTQRCDSFEMKWKV